MTNNRTIALFFLSALVTHVHAAQHNNQPTPPKDIWKAIETGDVAQVKAAIPDLSDPVARFSFEFDAKHSENGNNPLHVAVERDQLAIVQLLLTRKLFMEMKNNAEKTPLHLAAEHGHVAIAQELLTHGANPNEKDSGDDTALHIAAIYGNVKIMQLLLTWQADPHATAVYKRTPLHKAARGGHVDAARLLLNHGAQIDTRESTFGFTPLHWAASEGHELLTTLLLQHGSSATATDDCEMTPLHHAAGEGKVTTAQLLLNEGADLLAKTKQPSGNWTPLMLAVQGGRALMTQFLIRQGRARGYSLDTLLGDSTSLALYLALMQALGCMEPQALRFIKYGEGNANSSQRGENLILYLLEAGGNPDNQHDDIGMLHLAAEHDKGKVARMLLDHGANPNSEDTSGHGNSIYLASQNNRRNMMRLLVARGAKPIQTVPANPQEAQFQTELAQIGHNRRQMFRRILRSKGLPFDLIGHMAQFAPFDIARQ